MKIAKLSKIFLTGLLCAVFSLTGQSEVLAASSTLGGYDRAKTAKTNYRLLHGDKVMSEAKNDPELAAVMKKYIHGDIARQSRLTNTERQLVTLAVLATNQNHKMFRDAAEGALNSKVTPLEMRETLYHIAPYIGFPKVFEALAIQNEVLENAGIALPLPNQGVTDDTNRFDQGLKFQLDTYGERINTMRNNTPDYQKHLLDNLAAFCFGDTYTRGTLDLKTREMITMAAIGALGTGDAQYKSHVNGTLSAGATKEEVIGVITVMNPYIGFPRTLNCLRIANEVFNAQE